MNTFCALLSRTLLIASVILPLSSAIGQELSLGGLDFRRDSEVLTPEDRDYNILIGDLGIEMIYVGSLEYDDNSNLASEIAPFYSDDVTLLKNGLKLTADYPITPFLRLTGDLFVEWLWALDGDYEDGLFLSSADLFDDQYAEISFDFLLSDRQLFTIFDKIKRESRDIDASKGQPDLGVAYWENIVGARYEWEMTPLMDLGLGVERMDVWSNRAKFSFRDRTEYIYNVTLRWQANRDLNINPFYTYRDIEFEHTNDPLESGILKFRSNNDAQEHAVGVASDYRLSPTILLEATLGYEWLDFDVENRPQASDDGTSGIFGSVGVTQELTETFRHLASFSVDRDVNLATESNHAIEYETAYGMTWQFAPAWVLQGRVAWTHRSESDFYISGSGARKGGERSGNLYQEEIILNYLVNPKTTVAIWYRRADRFSDLPLREFEQNRVGLQWIYEF